MNTPSLDEETNPRCDNHHIFFEDSENLVVEFIDASNLNNGAYIVNIAVYPADTDSFVCSLIAKKILSGRIAKDSYMILSDKKLEQNEESKTYGWD